MDEILNSANEELKTIINELDASPGFEWKIWKTENKSGRITIWPVSSKDISIFREGKESISMSFQDVRHDSNLLNGESINIQMYSPNQIRKGMNRLPNQVLKAAIDKAKEYNVDFSFNKSLVHREEIQLNLDDVSESVNIVIENIKERCFGIQEFIRVLILE